MTFTGALRTFEKRKSTAAETACIGWKIPATRTNSVCTALETNVLGPIRGLQASKGEFSVAPEEPAADHLDRAPLSTPRKASPAGA